MGEVTQYIPYKVKDMWLPKWCRQEIKLAEAETLRIDQADYIGVKAEGPFKPENYRD